jgi:hypothetical protein
VVAYLIQIVTFVGIVASDVYWRWAPSIVVSLMAAAAAAFFVSAAYHARYAAMISWIGGYAQTCTGLVAFFAAYELVSRFFGITHVQDVSNGVLIATFVVLALATFGIRALSRVMAEKVDPAPKPERSSGERANNPPPSSS